MKTDELSEEREGRKDDSKTPGGDGWREGGGERATFRASTKVGASEWVVNHGLERSIARRLTEERWRKRGEESNERTTEGQGDGWGEQPSAWSLLESNRTMEKRRV